MELPAGDLPAPKTFYAVAFGWAFTDYALNYAAMTKRLDGDFNAGPAESSSNATGPYPPLRGCADDKLQLRGSRAGMKVLLLF